MCLDGGRRSGAIGWLGWHRGRHGRRDRRGQRDSGRRRRRRGTGRDTKCLGDTARSGRGNRRVGRVGGDGRGERVKATGNRRADGRADGRDERDVGEGNGRIDGRRGQRQGSEGGRGGGPVRAAGGRGRSVLGITVVPRNCAPACVRDTSRRADGEGRQGREGGGDAVRSLRDGLLDLGDLLGAERVEGGDAASLLQAKLGEDGLDEVPEDRAEEGQALDSVQKAFQLATVVHRVHSVNGASDLFRRGMHP